MKPICYEDRTPFRVIKHFEEIQHIGAYQRGLLEGAKTMRRAIEHRDECVRLGKGIDE